MVKTRLKRQNLVYLVSFFGHYCGVSAVFLPNFVLRFSFENGPVLGACGVKRGLVWGMVCRVVGRGVGIAGDEWVFTAVMCGAISAFAATFYFYI